MHKENVKYKFKSKYNVCQPLSVLYNKQFRAKRTGALEASFVDSFHN